MSKQNDDQLKRINSMFNNSKRRNSEITISDKETSTNCTVHHRNKRRDSIDSNRSISHNNNNNNRRSSNVHHRLATSVHNLTSINNNNLNNSNHLNNNSATIAASDIKKRNSITSSSHNLNSNKNNVNRRQSFTESFGHPSYDRTRKRNSWNVNMFKSIEHPSAFPSLLRSSDSTTLSSMDISRNGGDSSLSSHYSGIVGYTPNRRGSGGTNLTRRSSMSALSVNKNAKLTGGNIHGNNTMMRNKNFGGSSLYLRTDSSGTTNLVRRDSLSTRSISNIATKDYPPSLSSSRRGSTATRDYVSDRASSVISPTPSVTTTTTTTPPHQNGSMHSILRRSSIDYDKIDHKGDRLTKENLTRHVRILENDDNHDGIYNNRSRRQSSASSNDDLSFKMRRMSIDSLDWRRSSIDLAENDLSNLTLKSSANEKTEHEHHHHHDHLHHEHDRPQFIAITTLEDTQAIRCAEFHPSGKVYAIGSNSKTFRICEYPSLSEIREGHVTYEPTALFKRTKHHKGSIYCISWSPDGELIATGSNDKTIKLMRYDGIKKQLEGRETDLTMHDGTVRDLCFLEDNSNKASLLISGGAGDCKIYVTDCATATPFQALSGHGGSILSLYNWGGAMFVSGSQDKTVRFWDLRTRGCVNTIIPATTPGSRQGSPVTAVCVDPSGRLLVSGHEDSSCVLYDIRGNRPIQCFKPHTADLRSIRFSPSAYYLLTAGYDHKLALTDLQGDLTLPLPSVVVAHHADKVISGRWHPKDFSFISTSADKTVTLWALPPA